MTTNQHTIAPLPLLAGLSCIGGACALLLSDAWASGHWTVNHALQPILVLTAVAAAVAAHRSLLQFRLGTACAMAVLAVCGSLATIYGTLGRTSTDRADKAAIAATSSRALAIKQSDLATAREVARVECKSGFAKRCGNANERVDALAAEIGGMSVVVADPRADSIAELAHLIAGIPAARTRAIVSAVDPLVLPLTLELGSVLFLASAFPRNSRRRDATSPQLSPTDNQPITVAASADSCTAWTKDQALADFRKLKEVGAQRYLASRYGVDKSTISRWMAEWEAEGMVVRNRTGKEKAARTTLALAAPRSNKS